MKKIGFLSIFAFCTSTILSAQVTKESFNKAVELLNCSAVQLTLSNEQKSKFEVKCPCGSTTHESVNSFLISVGKLDKTISLSDEIENLKKEYKENWKKEEVISFLTVGIFSDKIKYQIIYEFAEKRKGQEKFEFLIKNFKQSCARILLERTAEAMPSNPDSNSQLSSLEQRIAELEKAQPATSNKSFLENISPYLSISSLFLTLIVIILIVRKKNTKVTYETLISKILESTRLLNLIKTQNGSFQLSNASASNSNEIKNVYTKINELELKISNLNSKIGTSNTQTPDIVLSKLPELKPQEQKTEIFYLSTPNADGSFNASSASISYREAATIYKFTKTSHSKANFQIEDKEASVRLALQYPDKNIDPACDAENAFNSKATKIKTVQLGEVELQGDKWVRNIKARIRYEN
jgi:hypothetical protein